MIVLSGYGAVAPRIKKKQCPAGQHWIRLRGCVDTAKEAERVLAEEKRVVVKEKIQVAVEEQKEQQLDIKKYLPVVGVIAVATLLLS